MSKMKCLIHHNNLNKWNKESHYEPIERKNKNWKNEKIRKFERMPRGQYHVSALYRYIDWASVRSGGEQPSIVH